MLDINRQHNADACSSLGDHLSLSYEGSWENEQSPRNVEVVWEKELVKVFVLQQHLHVCDHLQYRLVVYDVRRCIFCALYCISHSYTAIFLFYIASVPDNENNAVKCQRNDRFVAGEWSGH